LPAERYQCFVSVARPGPLEERLAALPNITLLRHKRLQWVKHDTRSLIQKTGDILALLFSVPGRVSRVQKLIADYRIDLVHTNSSVSLEGALAAACAKVPHVWHIRELFMLPSPKFHLVLGRQLSRFLICRLSQRVICISEAVRQQFGSLIERHPQQFPLIYNALENAISPPLPYKERRERLSSHRIGYLGRISEGKGLHELLDALAELHHQGVSAQVRIAGAFVDSAYEKRIHSQVSQLNLGQSIQFLGYQENTKQFFEELDVLAVPSANEPFGRVIIEAMANGIPCIAADAGGAPELIEHGQTGLLYPPGKPILLAQALQTLYKTPELGEKIRENAGRMLTERFTMETQIRMLEQCYQSLLH
jgi:glycosyltransferase involved in cell wall biosynthesis